MACWLVIFLPQAGDALADHGELGSWAVRLERSILRPDCYRCVPNLGALEVTPEAGKRNKVCGGVDDDEHSPGPDRGQSGVARTKASTGLSR
jgi:hypothetical protein